MTAFTLRSIAEADRAWVAQFWQEHWGGDSMVVRGEVYYAAQLPGFAAEQNGQVAGLVTYRISGRECEILSLDSLVKGQGIGAALIEAVRQAALENGCKRLFLVTTNDNIHALSFYQKRGFQLCTLRPGAVEASRKIKPSIPLTGDNGIPIRDELELEMTL